LDNSGEKEIHVPWLLTSRRSNSALFPHVLKQCATMRSFWDLPYLSLTSKGSWLHFGVTKPVVCPLTLVPITIIVHLCRTRANQSWELQSTHKMNISIILRSWRTNSPLRRRTLQ